MIIGPEEKPTKTERQQGDVQPNRQRRGDEEMPEQEQQISLTRSQKYWLRIGEQWGRWLLWFKVDGKR